MMLSYLVMCLVTLCFITLCSISLDVYLTQAEMFCSALLWPLFYALAIYAILFKDFSK